ncbi:MAG: hypothetical protein R2748_35620 [Bryobacterales bacterium]
MMMNRYVYEFEIPRLLAFCSAFCLAMPGAALAADTHVHKAQASGHAPIGVMGDHLHEKGEWMVSYRYMRMDMEGSRDGADRLAPEEIVTGYANPFFGMPMQPPTLRVVPLQMSMEMHMAGLMYAPHDRVTLMAMAQYVAKEMDHLTFAGPAGTTPLGEFTTKSEGFGDTTLTALIGLLSVPGHAVHFNAGISLPTGTLDESGTILTPMGTTPTVRLPYAMQLGSGTFDLKPGVTYRGHADAFSWGAQAGATIRLGENDEDYTLGDRYEGTVWAAYDWSHSLSTSLRVSGWTQGDIDGRDPLIVGPVQTADPGNYGGEVIEAHAGVNYRFNEGWLKGNRLAFEVSAPLYRNLNGPQMETDWSITLGWQLGF